MKKIIYFFLLLFFFAGCIQKFQPALKSPPTGYLVVEGIINSAGPATVNLTRTNLLTDSTELYETGATVQVEGNDNSIYPFAEQGKGVYGTALLNLNPAQQYRLRVKTTEGKEYLSDYAPAKVTPPIDSISWAQTNDGAQVYASTHDPQNNTIYYKWDYVETWEFHSPYYTDLAYDTAKDANGNPIYYGDGTPQIYVALTNDVNYSIFTCWKTQSSSEILVGSSNKLSTDVIADFPLVIIPQNSVKLGVEYSILVNQYALTSDAYNFLQIMKKNTEETGSIFSAQPSQLQGNIHCTTNPAEIVVGYVGFSTMVNKRIFINNAQLTNWIIDKPTDCPQNQYLNNKTQVTQTFYGGQLPTTPVTIDFASGAIISYNAAPARCVDCTLSGSNQQPAFWQ